MNAQTTPSTVDWQALADSTLQQAVQNNEVPGATVAIVSSDEVIFSAGFGISQTDSSNPVTDSTLFQVGSIGKVLTAMAVLQQVERGRLDLSTDVNSYLSELAIELPGEIPLTLHHLLTHSGGMNDRAIGYAVREPEALVGLDEHLNQNFPTFFAEPGRYISYSNYGYGLAGLVVENVTQTPFKDYVSSEILSPLGITESGYEPGPSVDQAIGYRKQEDSFVDFPPVYRPVTPAGSFVASARDMGRLLQAFLNNGSPVLSYMSIEAMTSVQMTMHPALMGNTYGLEESKWGAIRGFGKGGSIPGFMSYMVLLPDHNLGIFATVNSSSDAPIDAFILAAMQQLAPGSPTNPAPSTSVDVTSYAGEFRSNRYDRTSLEKLLNFDVRQVYATDENLRIWHDGAMNTYLPVETGLFQHADNPHRHLFFEVNEAGQPTHAYFNDRIAGGYVPVVWEKNGLLDSNLYVNEYFGVVMIGALGYLLLPIIALLAWLIRRRKPNVIHPGQTRRWMHLTGFFTSALLLVYVLVYFIPLLKSRPELIFGIPEQLTAWASLPAFIIGGFVVFAGLLVAVLRQADQRNWKLLFAGVYLACGILVSEFCIRWNLI